MPSLNHFYRFASVAVTLAFTAIACSSSSGTSVTNDEVCGSSSCVCNDSCNKSCKDTGCGFVCAEGKSCTFTCAAGDCGVSCAGTASCTVKCTGGNCTVNAPNGGSVSVDCGGKGDCTVNCAGAKTCTVDGKNQNTAGIPEFDAGF
jgi:hypothetical protein